METVAEIFIFQLQGKVSKKRPFGDGFILTT